MVSYGLIANETILSVQALYKSLIDIDLYGLIALLMI